MPQIREKRSRNTSGGNDGWPDSVNSRAEKSRNAAKMRRDKESEEITALSKLLPYPDDVTARLDKGSVIRLATSFLQMKKYCKKEGDALIDELKNKELDLPKVSEGHLMMQAWNGFLLFISRKGQIYYISEHATKHLGIHQYEMLGKSVLDFIHPDDHKELAKQFMVSVPGQQTFKGYGMEGTKDRPKAMSVNFFNQTDEKYVSVSDFIQERSFFLRMRSVMSKKSSSGKGKVVGYRVVNLTGRLKLKSSPNNSGFTVERLNCLCRLIQPMPVVEIRMDGNMFMSRHGMDMSFTFCDPRIITLIGYEPHELIGKTAYQFHNPLDAHKVSDCHSNLIVKGSSMSKYYRFLGKAGEWVWMRTKATIIYNTSGVAQYVVAMNYVVGKEEGERMLMMERMQAVISSPSSCSDGEACHSNDSSRDPSPALDVHRHPLAADQVSHYIPTVIQVQPILKPPSDNVDFSSLVPPEVPSFPTAVEVMEVSDDICTQPEPTSVQPVVSAASPIALNPSMSHMFQAELLKSDSPQSDLESVSSGSTNSVSSPPLATASLDSPMMDTGPPTGLSAHSPLYSSPGNLQNSPTSGGSRNPLEEFNESDIFSENPWLTPSQGDGRIFLGVTDLSGLEQSIPEALSEFSLEFNNCVDQAAQTFAAELGGSSELVDMTQIFEKDSLQASRSNVVITELPDNVPASSAMGSPMDPTPETEMPDAICSSSEPKSGVPLQGQYAENLSYLPNDSTTPRNVTVGLSKLKIKDSGLSSGSPAHESTKSLLKALLTGRGAVCQGKQGGERRPDMVSNGGYHTGRDMGGTINNNSLYQDDLTLFERQQHERLLLEYKQRQEQMHQMDQQLYQQQMCHQQGTDGQLYGYPGEVPMGDHPQESSYRLHHGMEYHMAHPPGDMAKNGSNGMHPSLVTCTPNNYHMNGGIHHSPNGYPYPVPTTYFTPPLSGPTLSSSTLHVSPSMVPLVHDRAPIIQNGGTPVISEVVAPQYVHSQMPLPDITSVPCTSESISAPWSSPVHQYTLGSGPIGPTSLAEERVRMVPYI